MADRPGPPDLGPYQYHEVLSSLRKTIKLADLDAAIYWLNVILTYGDKAGPGIAAKQLWIMAAEDIDDPIVVLRAFAVYQMRKEVSETDHLYFLVAQMVKAPKWWETEDGRAVDVAWARAIGDLKTAERRRPVPSFALDRHTRRGWALYRTGTPFDDRFSGTEFGRMKTTYLFLRDGSIGEDSQIDDGFWPFWRARKALMAERSAKAEEDGQENRHAPESDVAHDDDPQGNLFGGA